MTVTPIRLIRSITVAAAILLVSQQSALADPPARVGRLSYVSGTVSFHTADETEWSPAQLNYPVTTGSSFWADANSRSEIQVADTKIRMDQNTETEITQLDDNGTVITVPQGIVNINAARVPKAGMFIETPSGEVSLTKPGVYHIDAGHPDQANSDAAPAPTQVMVLKGGATVTTDTQNAKLLPGQNAVIGSNPPSFVVDRGQPTEFDNWAMAADQRQAAPKTAQYVSPDMTGYEDLDSAGTWDTTPEYGAVWYPQTVAVDWAPYRYGHWAYVAPWGWTWIDDAPWGFAPFHYGRWVHYHERWGWIPGERHVRPVYAPALVAFVGGNGFDINITSGRRVGWVPLGPREVFRPYYTANRNYVRDVNIANVNTTIINRVNIHNNITINNYANSRAASVVSADEFSRGRPVHNNLISVPHDQWNHATAARTLEHVSPTVEARRGGGNIPANVREAHPNHEVAIPASAHGGRGQRGDGHFDRNENARLNNPTPIQPSSVARNARVDSNPGNLQRPENAVPNNNFVPNNNVKHDRNVSVPHHDDPVRLQQNAREESRPNITRPEANPTALTTQQNNDAELARQQARQNERDRNHDNDRGNRRQSVEQSRSVPEAQPNVQPQSVKRNEGRNVGRREPAPSQPRVEAPHAESHHDEPKHEEKPHDNNTPADNTKHDDNNGGHGGGRDHH